MSQPRPVRVSYGGGDRLDIAIGSHRIVVDQPAVDGGGDTGPTPTELFVASLVSCMGFFAQRFLRQNDVDPGGLELEARAILGDRPARVATIDVSIALPESHEKLLQPLRRVIEHCTVHNALSSPPAVDVVLVRAGAQEETVKAQL